MQELNVDTVVHERDPNVVSVFSLSIKSRKLSIQNVVLTLEVVSAVEALGKNSVFMIWEISQFNVCKMSNLNIPLMF